VSRLHDLVTDTVANRLFRAMRVTQVSDRGPFREISLTSVSPRDTPWTPGDKIQVRVAGGGLTMRTYTPVRWENTTGDTTILVYLHGAGPGSAWAQDVAAGDTVQVVGPRRSIDLTRFTRAPIFVGDETSVGLRVRTKDVVAERDSVIGRMQLGMDICLEQADRVFDRFVAARVDLGAADETPAAVLRGWAGALERRGRTAHCRRGSAPDRDPWRRH
jgi:hypothetical protein